MSADELASIARLVKLPKLSELTIDVDKDWGGYKIKNLGAPVDAGDAVRKTDLDTHRTASPIDHPDLSITRTKLEYPTVDVSFAYLASINKVGYISFYMWSYIVVVKDLFTDKAVWNAKQVNASAWTFSRIQNHANMYGSQFDPPRSTADHSLHRLMAGTLTVLATEAIDIDFRGRGLAISCSGSTIKSLRYELLTTVDPLALPTPNATISATDTAFASGLFGFQPLRDYPPHGGNESGSAWLKAPLTPLPPAQSIIEINLEGSGKPEDPYRPSFSRNLVEITSLTGLPDFLYLEAKKYSILKDKGFTEDEMKLVFGYVPQHYVDLDSVTWGVFEFHPDKSPTVIITVTGDNPYKAGAIDRQKGKAKKVFKVPKDYSEAVSLYNQLKADYPHWLAGKDNFIYQVLGLEVFDYFQNVDFYHGELLDHKTHYQQLKQVSPQEIENRLNELVDRLSTVTVLTEERDKHISKAKEVLRKGW
jgi:hypothetical protein